MDLTIGSFFSFSNGVPTMDAFGNIHASPIAVTFVSPFFLSGGGVVE